ncbi:probable serine carboxypeptidase CPVL isoform X5 [Nycticebus coucang]|uniref:probable serine carboxypeptidase CPVL isoform X5 n=1 Tax=Nycticebus coucang TaxID=9470 RepID=UPI00234CEF0D|nr:probable serine carboxypeptidase CPVL isoform X5 [Nycticebus coucang]
MDYFAPYTEVPRFPCHLWEIQEGQYFLPLIFKKGRSRKKAWCRGICIHVLHRRKAAQSDECLAGELVRITDPGKEASLVTLSIEENMNSYAGYITVNETYNSNLFFWFFPAEVQTADAPVVLWLQGGPGGSSMFGLFVEHGPYIITSNMTMRTRDFPWTFTLSMLYVDNPVGTGFSFTDDTRGYAANEEDVARDLYSALIQFFQLFPEYKDNEFYATGEILDKLLDGDLTSDPSYFQNVTGCINYYNLLQCMEPEDQGYYAKFLSLPEVRQAIHVGNRTFNDGAIVEKYLRDDTVQSVKPWLAEIMNNYKVLIYNGQLDIIVAAPLTERSLMTIDWKGAKEYEKVEKKVWKIFKSDNEVAGYVRQVGDFHQVIVRGGGHILPYDQPLRSFDMINRFIYGRGWDPYS